MKILYGVQGTGNGHLTRARVMAKACKEKGIEVDWIFPAVTEAVFLIWKFLVTSKSIAA